MPNYNEGVIFHHEGAKLFVLSNQTLMYGLAIERTEGHWVLLGEISLSGG